MKYFLVVGRFPAGRERNKMNDYIKGQIEALEEVAAVVPEVRDTDLYKELAKTDDDELTEYQKGMRDGLETVVYELPEIVNTDTYRLMMDELPHEQISPAYIIGELARYGVNGRTELLGGGLVGVWIDLKNNMHGLITADYGLGVYTASEQEYDCLRFVDIADNLSTPNKLKLMATVLNYYGQPNN